MSAAFRYCFGQDKESLITLLNDILGESITDLEYLPNQVIAPNLEGKKPECLPERLESILKRAAGSLSRHALGLVYEWLDLHEEELMENWKRMESKHASSLIRVPRNATITALDVAE